jgi:hypothetical protein
MSKKIDVAILKIQNTIFKLLNGKNGVSVHFNFDGRGLLLITYNNITNEFFLLKEIEEFPVVMGDERNEGKSAELLFYEKLLIYVENLVKSIDNNSPSDMGESTYTVEWCRVSDGKTHISYFHGNSPEEVLAKFYFGKEGIKHLFKIFKIVLNPIS